MSATFEMKFNVDARELHHYLNEKMAHIEKISEDVFAGEGYYLAVMLFEHFFMRVSNQATLLVLIESTGPGETRLKTVGSGTSRGMFVKFDWGAAVSFAEEPFKHAKKQYSPIPE